MKLLARMLRRVLPPGGLVAALALGGCASYTSQTEALRSAWTAGNVEQAAQIATAEAKKKTGGGDALLWYLEAGATTRAAGEVPDSIGAFNQADGLIGYWDGQPDILISREAAATAVNQTVLPYRGKAYDKIMESTYQALNYTQSGNYDAARVEINRALERQRDALDANAKRIAASQQAAQDASKAARQSGGGSDTYDVQRAQGDAGFQANLHQAYGGLDAMKFYAPYVNPFSVFLQGVFFLARGQTLPEYERARVALEQVRGMIGDNGYITADCDLATQLAAGNATTTGNLTYVIFETGEAPIREEVRIDIPLFIVSREVPYVGVAFPQLKFNSQYNPGLIVRAGTQTYRTTLLCDMDAVIGQEFKNELPSIIVKTLISAGAKAAAQYGLYAATRRNNDLSLLVEIAGVVYQYATNEADLRTWVTLPKQFLYCRLPTPPDRKLQLVSQSTGLTQTVDLPPGRVTMVYAKSNSFADRLLLHAFPLSDSP